MKHKHLNITWIHYILSKICNYGIKNKLLTLLSIDNI